MAAALDLYKCMDRCDTLHLPKKQHDECDTTCETTFMGVAGSTETDDGHGGKVFRGATGDEVLVSATGGKVFRPA